MITWDVGDEVVLENGCIMGYTGPLGPARGIVVESGPHETIVQMEDGHFLPIPNMMLARF